MMSEFCTKCWNPFILHCKKDGATDTFLTLVLSKSWYLSVQYDSEQNCAVTGVWRRYIAGNPWRCLLLRLGICPKGMWNIGSANGTYPWRLHSWLLHQGQLGDEKAFYMLLLTAKMSRGTYSCQLLVSKISKNGPEVWKPYTDLPFLSSLQI